MALPLPSVVSDVGPGGPLVTAMRGNNALSQSNLDTNIKGTEAKYAPYTKYADALSKIAYANYLPYQIQSQVMSNPMLYMALKDNPEAITQLMQNFSKSIPSSQNVLGNINMPSPNSQRSNGLLSMLFDRLQGKRDAEANPMASGTMDQSQGGGNSNPFAGGATQAPQGTQVQQPLVPGASGGINGLIGVNTAKFNTSPYKEGSLIADPNNPGGVISVPSKKTISGLQNQISAAERLKPQLAALGKLWEPFMTAGGKFKLKAAEAGNLFGGDSDLPSKYADAQQSTFTTLESYLKTIGVPVTVDAQKELHEVIQPKLGESAKGYQARVAKTLDNITNEFVRQAQSQLSGGYSMGGTNGSTPSGASPTEQAPATENAGNSGGFDPTKMLDYKFKDADEFKQAFATLGPEAKQQVIAEMKKRGWK